MARDLSFEKLAEVVGLDWTGLTSSGRGQLNKALAEIREATPGLEDAELAMVIEAKATTYRRVMSGAMLTPTALAKHWAQLDGLLAEQERSVPIANVIMHPSDCTTCGGERLVLERHRPPFPSMWAIEQRSKRHPEMGLPHPTHRAVEDGYEEYLPCPSCNPVARADAIESVRRFERFHPRRLPTKQLSSNVRPKSREEK